MADTNYGLLFQKETAPSSGVYATLGKAFDVGLPEWSTEALNATNHSSAGKAAKIPSGLIEGGSFEVGLELEVAQLEALWADMEAKTIANYRIVMGDTLLDMFDFAAFPLKLAFPSAKSDKPDVLKMTVTFQATGDLTLTASEAEGDWFDNVTSIWFGCGGALALTHPTTHQLEVFANKGGGIYQLSATDILDLTIASSVTGKATVNINGLITTVASGNTTVSAYVTGHATIETAVNVVVS